MSTPTPESVQALGGVARFWWLFLITAVLWLVVAVVILQFDAASLATVGTIVGLMLLFTGIEQWFLVGAVRGVWKVVWLLFGLFFVAGGIWAILNPIGTVASLAQSLGLLFGLVALFWIIEAFSTRRSNPLWWLGLISGLLMAGLAIWVGGQLFGARVVTLLLFAGWWAILHAVGDVVRAVQLKRLGALVRDPAPAA
jgi:uncharacterized membrane protein HdeD (DUF308 family)